MRKALGMIESVGLTTAIAALDAASKAADITLVGYDKVIGVEKAVSVTIHIAGEVSAVNAAIDAGVEAGNRVGKIVSSKTIARPHEDIDFLIKEFEKNLKQKNNSKKLKENKNKEENN
ncbi:BMC domain-containing protein [Paraclostridium ghonii]|uniref:BMC domain-containing protein n=1 Tax=Paraclostridium ghonii TaxID=29358 RepID=UPI00202CD9AE|nr:BMC domain-containing protein [Paeniclostridium ghonii]MCM0166213.1 BMC domain-containing protein [Paeniclostridium ghonii]